MNLELDFTAPLARNTEPRYRMWGTRRVCVVAPGDTYNKLTVIEAAPGKRFKWLCRCECGNTKAYTAHAIATGHVKSCGCELKRVRSGEGSRRHGHGTRGKTPTYQTWQHMHYRCRNPKSRSFRIYGGRGITVCERWKLFDNFLADMGERPPGTSLDRINGNGNYEPSNCRWANSQQQAQNTSRAKLTQADAAVIRSLKGTISGRALGKKYGIAGNRISAIWRGEAWKLS